MADIEGRLSPGNLEVFDEEVLDPRIQLELERLNVASEEINTLELELDDARASFRQALSDTTHKLDALAKKLGACVEKARPYYDSRLRLKEVHVETQRAAYGYERACSMHEAAKEMVQLAEQGYMQREEPSDPAWQEMLNHATMKVNEAEHERLESEQIHRRTTSKFTEAEEEVQRLQKDLKRMIAKSKPYFEMKARFNQSMEDQKKNVSQLESKINSAKAAYSEALRNLEEISDGIHRQRLEMRSQAELGVRGAGVGSESPSPPPMRGKDPLSIDGTSSQHTSSCSTGNSQTTATTSQSHDANTSSHTFRPPSVIYSSPQKARSQSYRDAIEARKQSGVEEGDRGILGEITEDSSVDLDEEFMSLPDSRRLSVGRLSTSPKETTMKTVSPRELTAVSGEITPVVEAPKKPVKLQGLILKIGPGVDPLQTQQQTQTRQHQPVARRQTDPLSRPFSYPYTHNTVPHKPVTSPSQGSVKSVPSSGAMENKSNSSVQNDPKRLLKVPSVQDFDEGSISDTESITSGTMLDDEQVEFLTLDFSEQALDDPDDQIHVESHHRLSLPASLAHLEAFRKNQEGVCAERLGVQDVRSRIRSAESAVTGSVQSQGVIGKGGDEKRFGRVLSPDFDDPLHVNRAKVPP